MNQIKNIYFDGLITLVLSVGLGSSLGLWVQQLDPDGTGGSILAAPAIIVSSVISFLTLFSVSIR